MKGIIMAEKYTLPELPYDYAALEPVDFRRELFPTSVDNPVYQQAFQARYPLLP